MSSLENESVSLRKKNEKCLKNLNNKIAYSDENSPKCL
jgi:hypothetical protein